MLNKDTLRYASYAAVVVVILTLTGVFTSFERNRILTGQFTLNLSTFLLFMFTFGTGYITAWRARGGGVQAAVLNGAVGSLVVGGALALLVLLSVSVDTRELSFVFPNMGNLTRTTLVFDQESVTSGMILLMLFSGAMGLVAGFSFLIRERERVLVMLSLCLVVVVGLLQNQVRNVIALPDALAFLGVFALAYLVIGRLEGSGRLWQRVGAGFGIGVIAGAVLALIAGSGGLENGSLLRGAGDMPRVLATGLPWLPLILGVFGVMGALVVRAAPMIHNGMFYFLLTLVVLGFLNSQGRLNLEMALMLFVLLIIPLWRVPDLGERAQQQLSSIPRNDKRLTNRMAAVFALAVLLVAPIFMGQYITSVFDLVGLYIIMGIGLNVMVGYAGLLDLGFVASFAIGAYAMGLMTTPSMLTCGGIPPSQIPAAQIAETCTGILTFWSAWPLAALTAGVTGAMLGVPVLRLRGDYLAIVTLGFGEIINRLLLSSTFKDLLGGAQGISPIPQPVLDVTLPLVGRIFIQFGNAINIYYLILFSVLLVGMVVYRLANTRLGRAWRSIKADEDVAEAMGIHLVTNKLLAFGISSTLAGVGGAIFGAWLQGIFPNSFTLLVSINVLSLIIIGGLGSIPGVVVGSLMLIGLPEVLRELQDYRLLAFGALLVITMLLKPEGLIPPTVRRLSETLHESESEPEADKHETETTPEVSYG
jgi:branched-chain amino acid transport system permease protein